MGFKVAETTLFCGWRVLQQIPQRVGCRASEVLRREFKVPFGLEFPGISRKMEALDDRNIYSAQYWPQNS
jgi:hypothetical protein